jgi:hypothetical protein
MSKLTKSGTRNHSNIAKEQLRDDFVNPLITHPRIPGERDGDDLVHFTEGHEKSLILTLGCVVSRTLLAR